MSTTLEKQTIRHSPAKEQHNVSQLVSHLLALHLILMQTLFENP